MAGTFKAFGDHTRLKIIYLLATDTSGTLGVGELADRLGISQPAVSQHLKTLKGEGIVDSRRDGFYIYYTINRERMVKFGEHFEMMSASIMEKCNRELVRKSTSDRDIRACMIFKCLKGCPMGLDVNGMVRQKQMENADCILCASCADTCPENVISFAWTGK